MRLPETPQSSHSVHPRPDAFPDISTAFHTDPAPQDRPYPSGRSTHRNSDGDLRSGPFQVPRSPQDGQSEILFPACPAFHPASHDHSYLFVCSVEYLLNSSFHIPIPPYLTHPLMGHHIPIQLLSAELSDEKYCLTLPGSIPDFLSDIQTSKLNTLFSRCCSTRKFFFYVLIKFSFCVGMHFTKI